MIAVVTGASGFIGRNLVGRLCSDGVVVRCLTRVGGGVPPRGASAVEVDFADAESLRASNALADADVVFHLAGATRATSDAAFEAANVSPTRNLLEALSARKSSARFVFVSSQAAAGPARSLENPLTEADEARPVEAYGRSKLAAERVVATYAGRVASTILRPCSVFGRFDRDFLRLFQMARRGVVLYPGTERHWLSLVHVDDVVDALVTASSAPAAAGQTYFLASHALQWRALGERIGETVNRPVSHLNVPGTLVRAVSHLGDATALVTGDTPLLNANKAALTRHPFWLCSSDRAKNDLGWNPTRSLPDALRDTYLWYRQSGWLNGSPRSAVVA